MSRGAHECGSADGSIAWLDGLIVIVPRTTAPVLDRSVPCLGLRIVAILVDYLITDVTYVAILRFNYIATRFKCHFPFSGARYTV